MSCDAELAKISYCAKTRLCPRGAYSNQPVEIQVIPGHQRAICRFAKGLPDESLALEFALLKVNAEENNIIVEIPSVSEPWKFDSLSDETMTRLPAELSMAGALRDDFETHYRMINMRRDKVLREGGQKSRRALNTEPTFSGRARPLHGARTELALKVFPKGDAQKEKWLRTLRMVRHPNILSLGQVFVQMEPNGPHQVCACFGVLDGGSIFDEVRRVETGFLEPQALQVFEQVCLALEHTHKCGFIHQLVSPGSVVFVHKANYNHVRLTEFSYATKRDLVESDTLKTVGLPGYLGPEVLHGSTPQQSMDCFSAGATLFFMLMGSPLFASPDIPLTLKHNAKCHVRLDSPVLGGCHQLLKGLLDRNPEKRSSMTEALTVITELRNTQNEKEPVPRHSRPNVNPDLMLAAHVPHEIRVFQKPDGTWSRHFRPISGYDRDVSPTSGSSEGNPEPEGDSNATESIMWESLGALSKSTVQSPSQQVAPRLLSADPKSKGGYSAQASQPVVDKLNFSSPKATNSSASGKISGRKASAFDKFLVDNAASNS